jgi:hypothetical protein
MPFYSHIFPSLGRRSYAARVEVDPSQPEHLGVHLTDSFAKVCHPTGRCVRASAGSLKKRLKVLPPPGCSGNYFNQKVAEQCVYIYIYVYMNIYTCVCICICIRWLQASHPCHLDFQSWGGHLLAQNKSVSPIATPLWCCARPHCFAADGCHRAARGAAASFAAAGRARRMQPSTSGKHLWETPRRRLFVIENEWEVSGGHTSMPINANERLVIGLLKRAMGYFHVSTQGIWGDRGKN